MPNFVLELLALLTLPWVMWSIAGALLFISLLCNTEPDTDQGFPLLTTLFSIALFWLVSWNLGIAWQTIKHQWPVMIGYAVLYLIIGICWSYFKWHRFVIRVRDRFVSGAHSWCQKHDITWDNLKSSTFPADANFNAPVDFRNYMREQAHVRSYEQGWTTDPHDVFNQVRKNSIPRVTMHKAEVLNWILAWPVSVLSFCVRDLLRDLLNGVFNTVRGLFQSRADAAFDAIQ